MQNKQRKALTRRKKSVILYIQLLERNTFE
jgi:hypothetical protein